MYVPACACVCACARVRVCVCACACVCVCMCVRVCGQKQDEAEREGKPASSGPCTIAAALTHTQMCAHVRTHTHIQRTHVYTHTYLLKAGSFLAGVEMKDQLVAGSFALRAQQHLHCPGTFLQTHLSLFCSLEQCSKQKCGVCVHAA